MQEKKQRLVSVQRNPSLATKSIMLVKRSSASGKVIAPKLPSPPDAPRRHANNAQKSQKHIISRKIRTQLRTSDRCDRSAGS